MSEGFVVLPRSLLTHLSQLELNAVESLVLINLIGSWWSEDEHPFPRPSTIAARLGVHVRSIHRAIAKLEQKGFLRRNKALGSGRSANIVVTRYDLNGCVEKLKAVAIPNGAKVVAGTRLVRGATIQAAQA